MIDNDQLRDLLNAGGTVIGNDGEKIGSLEQVFLDDRSGNPEWVTVRTGLFGLSESFVPLLDATVKGEEVHVAFAKQTVKDAPRINGANDHLDQEAEQRLYEYYNRAYDHDQDLAERTSRASEGALPSDPDTRDDRTDRSDRPDHDWDDEVSSEQRRASEDDEQRPAGTATPRPGRVRLRKYIVTENVTKTIPVSHEEIRVEREPMDGADSEGGVRQAQPAGEDDVTLYEERLVVSKEKVPVERVRIDSEEPQSVDDDEGGLRRQRLDEESGTADERDRGDERRRERRDR